MFQVSVLDIEDCILLYINIWFKKTHSLILSFLQSSVYIWHVTYTLV